MNMILGDVEETITTVEIDDETYEEIIKVRFSSMEIIPCTHATGSVVETSISTDFKLNLLSFLSSDAKTHGAFPVC